MWWELYPGDSIVDKEWPEADVSLLEEDSIRIAIQINGKLRSEIEIEKNMVSEEIEEIALNDLKILKHLENAEVKKVIYVPGKIVNIVI